MANKWVYLFSEGNANMRELLGGKGANLAEMTGLGLPVPQGFTITTEACTQYYEDGREINEEIQGQINEYIVKMEEITGIGVAALLLPAAGQLDDDHQNAYRGEHEEEEQRQNPEAPVAPISAPAGAAPGVVAVIVGLICHSI